MLVDLQNFRILPTFTVTLQKTFLTFLGFEGASPVHFRLRVKTKEMAEEFQQALEAAVPSE